MISKLADEHAEWHVSELCPVQKKVFSYTCVEMSRGFTDRARCTACTREFVNHT